MYYLGIDPGSNGAICLLHPSSGGCSFFPTPSRDDGLSFNDIAARLWAFPNISLVRGAIEDVHSIYGMSAKSNFSFGWNVGLCHALLNMLRVGHILVPPKDWQKACSLPSQKKLGAYKLKQAVADVAHLLYPDAEIYGPRGGLLDGRADALLIAHYRYLMDQK